jgi:aminoglycoside phosphotransferase family enzyme/predicted kinase
MVTAAETPSTTLIDALRRQLGAGGAAVDLVETHISWVLLAGDTAWKVKKPVRLGFLDFSNLEQRQHFCAEELRLNRRFAPSLYLEVVAIGGTPPEPRLGGGGPPIEYALRMRRFAPRALLAEKLADGLLQPAHLDALAERVAALHGAADVAAADSPWGRPDAVAAEAQAVLARLQERGVDVTDLRGWLAAQVPALTPLWQHRRDAGWVRECHGDLHLGNAVVLDNGVTAFDCIEFAPALRWIDVQSDVAFLLMDLLAHRRADLGWRFVNAWLDAIGDHAGVAVLRFYVVYRAQVRALVSRLRAPTSAAEPSADDYLALARQVAREPLRPRLLVTHGLSGSGKTQLSQRLLEITGAIRVRSDVERKRLFGIGALDASRQRVPDGIYGAEATKRTYERLYELAQLLLQAGYPVIVDAACLRRVERAAFGALAAALRVPFTLLDCRADAQTLRERVRARQQRRDDASEADEAELARQLTFAEPLSDAERAVAVEADTTGPLDVAAIAARWLAMPGP